MKLYVIQINNGEQFEDKVEWIGGIFSTKEKAIKYLTDLDFKSVDDDYYKLDIYPYEYVDYVENHFADIEEFVLDYPDWEGRYGV